MSPEQACGGHVDKGTDIWNVGVVLYEMVTGHAPFTGDTPGEAMSSILEMEPPPLTKFLAHTPPELQQIVSKTLRKERGQRYHSAHKLLEALKDLRRKLEFGAELERATAAPSWLRWTRSPTALVLVLLMSALALALPFYWHRNLPASLPPEKSIAVLPFENLGEQKENTSFADGVQDDILTKLAKIADLKVISRTSVMDYRGKRNVRQIADALRVSHVLEGSARRSGDRIHLNAQLIDTRTDTHVWVEQYDRDLNDLFAIQSEIAQKVAEHLHAKLSAREKASIEEKPTQDLMAYDFYIRALSLISNAQVPTMEGTVDLYEAVDLLNQAVARDPNFFLAYCQLAFVHDLVYQEEFDRTPARLALAKSAIDSAFRLRPDSGEAHLALGWHLYLGSSDYDRARAELAVVQQSLPNNPRAFELAGLINRTEGRWADATRNLERACELDPRNVPCLTTLSSTYYWLHDYDQVARLIDRVIALLPAQKEYRIIRAWLESDQRADTGPSRAAIEKILTKEPGSEKDPFVAHWRLGLALYDRELDAAGALAAARSQWHGGWGGRDFWLGRVARLKGDVAAARAAFMRARTQLEEELRDHPDDISRLSHLGLIDAALGRKEEALSEGRRAMELVPIAPEAIKGPYTNEGFTRMWFAVICAWAGERELALEQLEVLAKIPGGPSYGRLRLDPVWDPLRGDPRFEKIVASLAPK
jgi:TolB-like protein/Tfp pilus assembly protein PilF